MIYFSFRHEIRLLGILGALFFFISEYNTGMLILQIVFIILCFLISLRFPSMIITNNIGIRYRGKHYPWNKLYANEKVNIGHSRILFKRIKRNINHELTLNYLTIPYANTIRNYDNLIKEISSKTNLNSEKRNYRNIKIISNFMLAAGIFVFTAGALSPPARENMKKFPSVSMELLNMITYEAWIAIIITIIILSSFLALIGYINK